MILLSLKFCRHCAQHQQHSKLLLSSLHRFQVIGISTQQLPIRPLTAFHLQRFSSFATQNCLHTTAQFSSLLPPYHQVNKQLWRPPQPQIYRQYTTSTSNGKSNGKKNGNGQKHKKEEEQVPPEGLFKKLHFYLKHYWYIALPVHTAVCAIWFVALYLAVQSGLDVVALLQRLHLPENWVKKVRDMPKAAGSLAAALVLYKIFTPLRYACSILGIRLAYNWLKSAGYLRTAGQLRKEGVEKTKAMRHKLAGHQRKLSARIRLEANKRRWR